MASPITHILAQPKDEVVQRFPAVLEELGISMLGSDKELGLFSFRIKNDPVLYAHISERKAGETTVSIAPGLQNLANQAELSISPVAADNIFKALKMPVKKEPKP